MKNYKTLQFEIQNSTAWLSLNRPEVHNAFNEEMISELTDFFEEVSSDPQIRAIVVQGGGESFCAGADLNWMKKMAGFSFEENVADAERLHYMLLSIYRCAKPVIAKIHGACMGGGLGIASAADFVFADQNSSFCFSEVKLGLVPAVISPFVIRKISKARARELFLTAEKFSAERAYQVGLLSGYGDSTQVQKLVDEKLKLILAAGPEAISECKKLLEEIDGKSIEEAGTMTTHFIAERRASTEGKEGIQAFFEKRRANW